MRVRSDLFIARETPSTSPSPPPEERVGERRPFSRRREVRREGRVTGCGGWISERQPHRHDSILNSNVSGPGLSSDLATSSPFSARKISSQNGQFCRWHLDCLLFLV